MSTEDTRSSEQLAVNGPSADSLEFPSVSVIIPARDEARYIEQNVRSVLANDYPADRLEVVVVDSMSEDGTGDILRKIAAEDSRVRYVPNPARTTPAAFNLGVRASKGDVVFIVSGHATVRPDFIRLCVQALREHPEAWCAGGCIETISDNYTGRCISAAMSSPIGVGDAMFRLGSHKGFVGTVAFGAYWRWVFDSIGYFDEQLLRNQDDDFNQRILLAGGKIYLDSDIRSSYYSRGSFKELTRQYYEYGFWRIRTLQKHRKPLKFRQIVPLLFITTLLVSLVSAFLWQPLRYDLAGLGILYALVLLAGVVDVARRKGISEALLAPVVFVILHFGYGIGNLAGIWRFIICDGGGIPKLARSLPAAVIATAASLAVVAGFDFVLDPRVSLNFFYVVPLALSVILLGRTAGIVCAFLAGIESILDHSMAPGHSGPAVLIWNAAMRTGTLLVACFLLDIWWRRRTPETAAAAQPSLPVLLLRAIFMPPDPADRMTFRQTLKEFLKSLALVYIPLVAFAYAGYALGPKRVSLSPFYALLVIVAVLRQRGALGGMVCAFCGGAAFLTIHLLSGDDRALWNATMRLAILLTIAILAWAALIKAHTDPEKIG